MNEKYLLGPIIIRYVFFILNTFFTVTLVGSNGWGFFPVVLAGFATRDFVQATQLAQVYYHLKKNMDQKK